MTVPCEPTCVRKDFGTACVEDLYVVTADGREHRSGAREKWWK
jgi:hypothetical protein